jgi:hypothetical protein
MIQSSFQPGHPGAEQRDAEADRVDEIVESGPHGAIALAGTATAIVIALWFAF